MKWTRLFLAWLSIAYPVLVDVCIIGDSTLQMFANAWIACEAPSELACAFKVLDSGIYYLQKRPERTYQRKTRLVRSIRYNSTALFADFHDLQWLAMVRGFWIERGRRIECRRTITNYHHHAGAYLNQTRTATSVAEMMQEAQQAVHEYLGTTEPLAWLLPTMPLDNNRAFLQTIAGVAETAALMAASGTETNALLHVLAARLQRMGGTFADRMHVRRDRLLGDSFTVRAVQSFLVTEFKRAASAQFSSEAHLIAK